MNPFDRLLEIANSHAIGITSGDMLKIIERVKIVRIKDMEDLRKLIYELEKLVAESSANLVILDSIAFLLHDSVSRSKTYYASIYETTEKLTTISKYYHIPIVVTNRTTHMMAHLSPSPNLHGSQPLLGYLWLYCCNIKLGTHLVGDSKEVYEMVILKSPFSTAHRLGYSIQNSGLVPRD
jgi:hypothetical protein